MARACLGRSCRRPCSPACPIKPALTQGIEERRLEGVLVRLTRPTRTVVVCFKYRNKIGLDVSLEALRAHRRRKDFKLDDMWKYATLQRVARIMKPYLEAIA